MAPRCPNSPNGKHDMAPNGKPYFRMEPKPGSPGQQRKVKIQPTKCTFCGRKGEN